ncbi:MAG TPA: zincin-like metallopeptidase domain-containing protein [Niabella sp.]|nr:zincin-like metallopeptidase domain-containing protein [Niabella sp.]
MKPANTTKSIKDTYREVTDFVMEQLEKGIIVWRKGWSNKGCPKNIVTGLPYRGWNVFFLNHITRLKEYPTPYFITFKQVQAKGGHIRKGEKGMHIIYWAKIEDKQESNTDPATDEESKSIKLVPRIYTVFNIAQTEGIELPEESAPAETIIDSLVACDRIVNNMPNAPQIRYSGDRAWYSPARDLVNIPEKALFTSTEDHYCTLFHELAHSTGHASRLNRKELVTSDGFGGELYSKEELTAEMAAAFLCSVGGIEQEETLINSAAYIGGWLESLSNDKTLVIRAAAQAQKAADYILNRVAETTETPVH